MVEAVKPNDPDKGWGRPPPDQADWVYCTADEDKLDYNLVISLDEYAATTDTHRSSTVSWADMASTQLILRRAQPSLMADTRSVAHRIR